MAQFGRIDVLVNNAAAPHGADRRLLWEIPEEAWDLVIGVNLKGTFLMSRAVIPHMLERGSGRIISMASVSGKRGTAGRGAYTASKFGVIGLTQVMAQELGAHGAVRQTAHAVLAGHEALKTIARPRKPANRNLRSDDRRSPFAAWPTAMRRAPSVTTGCRGLLTPLLAVLSNGRFGPVV